MRMLLYLLIVLSVLAEVYMPAVSDLKPHHNVSWNASIETSLQPAQVGGVPLEEITRRL